MRAVARVPAALARAMLRGLAAWALPIALLAAWEAASLAGLIPVRVLPAPSDVAIAFWQNLWAALVLLPLALATDGIPALDGRSVALLLVLGLLCTAFAHTLFIGALTRVTAHAASVIAALEPVYGIVLALLLLGEVPSLRTLVGAVLIVGAAIVATRRADGAR